MVTSFADVQQHSNGGMAWIGNGPKGWCLFRDGDCAHNHDWNTGIQRFSSGDEVTITIDSDNHTFSCESSRGGARTNVYRGLPSPLYFAVSAQSGAKFEVVDVSQLHGSSTTSSGGDSRSSSDATRALEARIEEITGEIAAVERRKADAQRMGEHLAHQVRELLGRSPVAEAVPPQACEPEPEPAPSQPVRQVAPSRSPASLPKPRRRSPQSAADALGWASGSVPIAAALATHCDTLQLDRTERSASFTDARDERMAREIEQMESAARQFEFALSPALPGASRTTPQLDMIAASPSPF
eukprot:COSAG02_NODE_4771_length_4995_cov_3.275735_3_plen_298_part_00